MSIETKKSAINPQHVNMPTAAKTQRVIAAGDVQLSLYEWGQHSPDQPSIILIHGYPDDASTWDRLVGDLAQYYHVVSYDVRGTGQSSAPISTKGYRFEYLMADLGHVIAHVSPSQKVHLVGHDWGALQGWEAVFDPKLQHKILSYSALAPSLDHVGQWFHTHIKTLNPLRQLKAAQQLISSAYMGFFNLPFIPELMWNMGAAKHWPTILNRIEKQKVQHDQHSSQQLRNGVNGLALYRKNLLPKLLYPKNRNTSVAVHVISMKLDPFVPQQMMHGLEKNVDAQFKRSDVEAGHWGILTHPTEIAQLMKAYFDGFQASQWQNDVN